MKHIGGNTTAVIQLKSTSSTLNSIGERENVWTDVATLTGWLDLSSGDSRYSTASSKVQESTHMFLCDFQPIDRSTENKRMVINGERYDVLLIDVPMELNQHMEIYLKYIGAVV